MNHRAFVSMLTSMFISVLIFSLGMSSIALGGGGSGVGNGGDTVSNSLEKSRRNLIRALRILASDPMGKDFICQDLSDLSLEQKAECRDFILSTLDEVIVLNVTPPIPAFILTEEPLYIAGLDGRPMQVDARTSLGSTGDIELAYQNVKFYSPIQLLGLIAHEFGHKVTYGSRVIDDHSMTHHFRTGRQLLDAVGSALSNYAIKQRIISTSTTLKDVFNCSIDIGNDAPYVLRFGGASPRRFFDAVKYDFYEVSVGKKSRDVVVKIDEGSSNIEFRIQIHEENGCFDSFKTVGG